MNAVKKILCPVDFSGVSDEVAEYAAQQAACSGAEVLVLHVLPALYLHADTDVPYSIEEKFMRENEQHARACMESFVPKHFPAGNATGKVITGYAPESIIEVIKNESIDLVVIGTHGMKAMHVMLFGSVTEKVLKLSPVPVLVVRPSSQAA